VLIVYQAKPIHGLPRLLAAVRCYYPHVACWRLQVDQAGQPRLLPWEETTPPADVRTIVIQPAAVKPDAPADADEPIGAREPAINGDDGDDADDGQLLTPGELEMLLGEDDANVSLTP
jgi:hypothetical protein